MSHELIQSVSSGDPEHAARQAAEEAAAYEAHVRELAEWVGPVRADPTPEIFHFSREPAPQITTTVEELAHGLRDQQIYDPDNPTAEEEQIMKNASRACAKCPGHCCTAFTLAFTIEEIPEQIAKDQAEVDRLEELSDLRYNIANFHEHGRPENGINDQEQQRLEVMREELRTLKFFRETLVPADGAHLLDSYERTHTFRCTAFDLETRRCTRYADRPKLCRKYVCGPACAGVTPDPKLMTSGRLQQLIQENARTTLSDSGCHRGRKGCQGGCGCAGGAEAPLRGTGGSESKARAGSPRVGSKNLGGKFLPVSDGATARDVQKAER